MSILDTMDASLANFRPKTHRQFVVFNIARQFDDLANLARYLNVCDRHARNVLIEAARLATRQAHNEQRSPAHVFFETLTRWQEGGGHV